jgi:anti-sigma-K factor RskA
MSACSDCQELLGGYVLGALDRSERDAVERHLETCPSCRRDRDELAGVPALLDLLDTPEPSPAAPPPTLEEAVLDRFARERRRLEPRRRPRRQRRALRIGAAAAAGVATVILALAVAGVFSSSSDESDFARVRLEGSTGAVATADLRALRAGTGVRLSVRGLPTRREAVYELWCVTDSGRWISGGTFRVDREGRARVALTSAARPGDYDLMLITRRADRRRIMAGRVSY